MQGLQERLEARVLEWCKGIPEFEPLLATGGAYLAISYLRNQAELDEGRLLPLALAVSFWTWLDDRSDRHIDAPVVVWEDMIAVAQGRLEPVAPCTPEVEFLFKLSRMLKQQARTSADYHWWQATAVSVLKAFIREEEVSRSGQPLSYAEYLAVGAQSITVDNLAAASSLVGGLGLAGRILQPGLEQGIRYLCTVARLENDLVSYEKDRRERCLANATLVMERFMPLQQAVVFVTAERRAYEELLKGVFTRLEPEDPFIQLARNMLDGHAQFYELCRARYSNQRAQAAS